MDSAFASTSTPLPHHHRQFVPSEPLTERVSRAFEHRIRLLDRSNSEFHIIGATGNVYTVTISASPSCTCPDRTVPCKHILFVYLRVLRISLDEPYLWRRNLRPCQLTRILALPTSYEAVASTGARERFRQLMRGGGGAAAEASVVAEEGDTCPVCLEEMVVEGRREKMVVACASCKNPIHEECLLAWKRSSRRRSTSCVICRARWRDRAEAEKYLNLSAYVSEEEDMAVDYGGDGSGNGGEEANYCGGDR